MAQALAHPKTVRILDISILNKTYYEMIYEKADNGSLREFIQKRGEWPIDEE